MGHGTLPSNDIIIYVYEVPRSKFHSLQSYAPNIEILRTDVTDRG